MALSPPVKIAYQPLEIQAGYGVFQQGIFAKETIMKTVPVSTVIWFWTQASEPSSDAESPPP